jgi:hypothetical protein
MRKWIVKNFVFGTWAKIGNVKFHILRMHRVIIPLLTVTGLTMLTDLNYLTFQWFDIVLLTILLTSLWIGYNLFKISYFSLWPFKYEEMDDEQKYDYLRAIKEYDIPNPEIEGRFGPLNRQQMEEHYRLTQIHEARYKKRFAGITNLIPSVISLIIIVTWNLYIFPHFNF